MANSFYDASDAMGLLRMRPRTSNFEGGFSTDEEELIQMEFQSSSDSNVEHGHREGAINMLKKKKKKKRQVGRGNMHFDIRNRNNFDDSDDDVKSDDSYDKYLKDGLFMSAEELARLFQNDHKSVFTEVFENDEYREIVKPLFGENMTEELQFKLTNVDSSGNIGRKNIDKKTNLQDVVNKKQGKSRYGLVGKNMKNRLKKEAGSFFLRELETEVVKYLKYCREFQEKNDELKKLTKEERKKVLKEEDFMLLPLIIKFNDTFTRYLSHGLCAFYCLNSENINFSDQKYSIITYPLELHVPSPDVSLSDYLLSIRKEKGLDEELNQPNEKMKKNHDILESLYMKPNYTILNKEESKDLIRKIDELAEEERKRKSLLKRTKRRLKNKRYRKKKTEKNNGKTVVTSI